MIANVKKVAVVIPCYAVRDHVSAVISKIGGEVCRIFIVDDCCPEKTGVFVLNNCNDIRVTVLFHETNQGVGGAVMTGYKAAIEEGIDIIVKIDGDGQMDPSIINDFIEPISVGLADYTKGNRFFNLEKIQNMPKVRLFGNAALSFVTKLSSGYWDLFDPTNGYTAIHGDVARLIPFEKISTRYFFESDLLFRLNCVRAVVVDVPMDAFYGDEISNLRIYKIAGEFLRKHIRNFSKRIFYNYYLRDMSIASVELPLGVSLLLFGSGFGVYHWYHSSQAGLATPVGTVMLAALPIMLGFQLILGFLSYDIVNRPSVPIHKSIAVKRNIGE